MSTGTLQPPVGPGDHAQGPADAPITLVEYGDYECPHCAAAHGVVRTVQRELGGSLRYVFRNFPLRQAHPHAAHAAEAAESIARHGGEERFWAMHDWMFAHQHTLADEYLLERAAALGVEAQAVEDDLSAGAMASRVHHDFRSGVRSGVNGTPTFFVNGRRFDGDWRDASALAGALRNAEPA